jgi:hypothetical protein
MDDLKRLLLCFGDRRTAVEVPRDGGWAEVLQAVRREYGEAVGVEPFSSSGTLGLTAGWI